VRQDITKIDYAIETGEFNHNEALNTALNATSTNTVHIMGLLSDGGVHAHTQHIYQLIKLAAENSTIKHIWLHAFLDGRDTPPQSAEKYLLELEQVLQQYPQAKLATISGRYYAMDRDKRWDRIELAYQTLVNAKSTQVYTNQFVALQEAYANNIYDEFVVPSSFNNYSGMHDGDSVIFANFRSDRAIQLSQALIDPNFNGFSRQLINLASYVTMTRYTTSLDCLIAFPPVAIKNTLGEYISNLGLKQLRIAETEKYPHVTYFFNGGEQQPFTNETRILINSPKEVATYDLKPEMSLPQVADELIKAINSQEYDLIIANFANGDMVGHTGNYAASIKAVEALDLYLGKVVEAMQQQNGEVLIVADHGNCEEMFDYTAKQPHTQHTTNLVPCIYIGKAATIRQGGSLQDVAPTLLAMLSLNQPQEMTGTSLIDWTN
jgi:2,3-bisphosphoglycerate-independent phosphoglycerate mutase